MNRLLGMVLALHFPLWASTAADVARAIRENSFDRGECYRVRDLRLVKEDLRIYLTDGHLIFSKPVAGRRIAAVFAADVEGGDGEVILLQPDRAERRSLAAYTGSPNLDEHFRAVLLLFTGGDYEQLKSQLPENPANKKTPDIGALLDEQWSPVLRNLAASFEVRLTLDLLGAPARRGGLFAALFSGNKLGNFDIVYEPDKMEQILAGRVTTRDNRLFFDTWTSPRPSAPTLGLHVDRVARRDRHHRGFDRLALACRSSSARSAALAVGWAVPTKTSRKTTNRSPVGTAHPTRTAAANRPAPPRRERA